MKALRILAAMAAAAGMLAFGAAAHSQAAKGPTPVVTGTVKLSIKGPDGKAIASGDVANGAKVFKQCASCHVVAPGQNRVGPTLHKVIGRKAGSVAGFKYSKANASSGIVWTEQEMFTYLERPSAKIKGTTMAFVGLKKPQDRADVIAYMIANSK